MKLSCLKNKPEDETEQADNDCPQEDTKRKAQILQVLELFIWSINSIPLFFNEFLQVTK